MSRRAEMLSAGFVEELWFVKSNMHTCTGLVDGRLPRSSLCCATNSRKHHLLTLFRRLPKTSRPAPSRGVSCFASASVSLSRRRQFVVVVVEIGRRHCNTNVLPRWESSRMTRAALRSPPRIALSAGFFLARRAIGLAGCDGMPSQAGLAGMDWRSVGGMPGALCALRAVFTIALSVNAVLSLR